MPLWIRALLLWLQKNFYHSLELCIRTSYPIYSLKGGRTQLVFEDDMGIVNLSGYAPIQNNISTGIGDNEKKSKGSEKDNISFGDVMNLVGDSGKKTGNDKISESAKVDKDDKDYVDTISDKRYDKTSDKQICNDKKYDKNKTVSGESMTCDTETDSDEMSMEEAGELIRQAIELICRLLNVDEEQVTGAIEKLGTDMSLLTDDAGIRQLALSIMGATEVDILVDEELSKNISDLAKELGKLFEAYDDAVKQELVIDSYAESGVEAIADNVSEYAAEKENGTDKPKTDEQALDSVLTEDDIKPDFEAKITDKATSDQDTRKDSKHSDGKSSNYDRLTQALADVITEIQDTTDITSEIKDVSIVRQVVDDIRANISDKVRSLELQLNPESLGKVWINVSTKDGVLQARIVAENEAAKQAIENSLTVLKEAFDDKELKVEAIEVMVGSENYFDENAETEEYENNKNNRGSGGNSEHGSDDIIDEGLTEATQLEKEMMQQAGNSVSYSI